MSEELCDEIADFRRWAQRIANNKLLFIDETHLRVKEAPRKTLVAQGETAFIIVEDNSQFAARYDMIAAILGDQQLPPMIYTPDDRAELGVDGINADMLNDYIINLLGPAVGALDRYGIRLIVDRASIHNTSRMIESFHEGACYEIIEARKLPTKSAKRISPLDNSLFHEWKERCRQHSPLTDGNIVQSMTDEWNNIPINHISNYYRHCGLTCRQSLYSDCPEPDQHRHN